MQSNLTSLYLDWYVTVDPGPVYVKPGVLTGASLLWFKPKHGLDADNEICIAAGSSEEILIFKSKLEEKRAQNASHHSKYLKIEQALLDRDWSTIDSIKTGLSEWQKERMVRMRKK